MHVHPRLVAIPLTAGLLLVSPSVGAQFALTAQQDSNPEIQRVEVAANRGANSHSLWFRAVATSVSRQKWLEVLVLRPADRVDVTSDAWFEALHEATSPRLLPPDHPPATPCQAPPQDAVAVVDDLSHVPAVAIEQWIGPTDAAGLTSAALRHGIALHQADWDSDLPALEQDGYKFAALVFSVPAGSFVLPTVRIQRSNQTAAASIPLVLNRAGADGTDLVAWLFDRTSVLPDSTPWAKVDTTQLRWILDRHPFATNYSDVVSTALSKTHGALWFVEQSERFPLASERKSPDEPVSLPSVGRTYLERFDAYCSESLPVNRCVGELKRLESESKTMGQACAPGKALLVPNEDGTVPLCTELVDPGELDPKRLRCTDQADDLALALSGLSPSSARVTRWRGWVAPWKNRRGVSSTSGSVELSPVLRCNDWDDGSCGGKDGGVGGTGGSGGTGGTQGSGGSGGYSTGGGPSRYYDPDEVAARRRETGGGDTYIETSCWGTSTTVEEPDDQGEDSTCSGDSSGEDETCSGDSSGGSDDEGCSGDSSGSDGDETCSGDSSGGSDDESCGGDSSGGGDETCSGDGSGDSDCSISRGRRKRRRIPSLATAWLLALVALPLRRWAGRKKRRSRDRKGRE